MDVNKTLTERAKFFGKVKSADRASVAVMCNAGRSCFRITFVCVNRDAKSRTLGILFWRGKLFRKWNVRTRVGGIPRIANLR